MSTTIVVVPCYNEANRLDVDAFKSFANGYPGIRFLFVNDGSHDRTLEILRELEAYDPLAFTAHSVEKNGGKAAAVRVGILRALDISSDFVAFWDADLATPLETIPDFRAILEARPEIQVVIGSRVNLLGRLIERQPMRHYLGRIAATLASMTLRLSVYDTQCGAKMFRSNQETRDLFDELFRTRWIFDIEILARLIRRRHRLHLPPVTSAVYEHPLMVWRDVRGSNIKAGDFLKSFLELRIIRKYYLSRKQLHSN